MRNRPWFGAIFPKLPALCVISCASIALAVQSGEPAALEIGKTLDGELAGTESHEFQLTLNKGQYAQLLVEQRSINVAIACIGPDGQQWFEVDTYLTGEPETIEMIASVSGSYAFRVRASDPKAPRGSYGITLRAGEGIALNALGTAYARTGEKRRALACFEEAAEVLRPLQDRSKLASIAGNIGVTYSDLGEYRHALDSYRRGLALYREIGNRAGEALQLNNIGTVYSNLAEYQKALDAHLTALEINKSFNNRWNVAINLNNIAWIYSSLGDRRRALNYYQEALEILRTIKDQWGLGHTLNNVGEIYAALGEHEKALAFHNEGLASRRIVKDPDGEAVSQNNIGRIHAKLGQREEARHDYQHALEIARRVGDPRLLASTLRSIGALSRETGEQQQSREYLDEALKVSRAIQDRRGEASALSELARLERDCGNLSEARRRADEALAAFESLRLTVASPALRASFFTSAREVEELEIDVLMRLHCQRPKEGYDAEALSVVERGRARSLLEMLGESGAEIREGVDPQLLDRERELVRLIGGKAERQTRVLSGKYNEAEASVARRELDALTAELDQVQSRIRESSPQYAALTRPAPLNLRKIQAEVLDEDTILLEYSLGAEKSFLWAVTPNSAVVFVLPARADVESAAKRLSDLLNARNRKLPETPAARAERLRQADAAYIDAAQEASRILLGPVAFRLANKRLLIVPDGVLQNLSFSALAEPAGEKSPLIVKHEIVVAPSASVVGLLRHDNGTRRVADQALAIVADPVFSADDARIARQPNAPSGEANRSAAGAGVQDFLRLRFSRREADEIARLLPAGAALKALDFDASREKVLSSDFGRHRIVHFATHSVLNNERPELSGVVLSLFDQSGRPRDGFLRLYEIYNLHLSSDLVVLSACQTALGGEIRGEGLIGLTRGFLYAGARSVVASLWEVDDRTSAELMKHFYEGILVRGERPAAALKAAQVAMWKTRGWDAPYYWAAYTLQGEWR
jgi:CHAT domain-containing protein/Tfp pilus assembly protein PilF